MSRVSDAGDEERLPSPTVPFYAAEFVAVLPGHEQPTTPGSLQGQKRDKRSRDAEESKTKLGMALRKQKQADL